MLNAECGNLRIGMVFRYVLLHHTGLAEPHFDLLVEVDGMDKLMAWRMETEPEEWGRIPGHQIRAVRIADHRKIYMTYEGEISGGRGEVRRIMEGAGKILSVTAFNIALELNPPPLIRIELPLR